MEVVRDASLKRYNTFNIAARAGFFAQAQSVGEVLAVMEEHAGKPLLILGGGSNILFTEDFPGLVLQNRFTGMEVTDENDDFVWLKAGAGKNWHSLVRYCIDHDYGGIENLSLIPGNVGASPMQNIGAYGVEIKDSFHSLEALELATGRLRTFSNEACAFGYRESVFKRELRNQYLIVSVTYRLTRKAHRLNTSYGAIGNQLEKMGVKEPDLRAISDAVITIRQSKLPDPAEIGNAGSFFKNPVVPLSLYQSVKDRYPDVVSYPAGDGQVKLAAGWLIEKAGWKGYRRGDAGVHDLQALVLVNYGEATGKEIFQLSQDILDDVGEKFGVELEREVNIY